MSAGELFDLIMPAASCDLGACFQPGYSLPPANDFRLYFAFALAIGTLFLPLIVFPIYLRDYAVAQAERSAAALALRVAAALRGDSYRRYCDVLLSRSAQCRRSSRTSDTSKARRRFERSDS